MDKYLFCLIILLFFLNGESFANGGKGIKELIERIIPGRAKYFEISYIVADSDRDIYELESRGGKIILKGNNNSSLGVAFYYYLRNYCHASVFWTGYQPSLSAKLPDVPKKITRDISLSIQIFFYY